jgi:hypothetical protein
MRPRAALIAALVCAHLLPGSPAAAQSGSEPAAGRIEIAAGPWWMGASSVGARDATLTAPNGGPFRLFSTSSELASASGVELRVATRVAPFLDAEVVASYGVPRLTTSVSADTENGPATTASEPIRQIAIEGAAVIYVARRPGPRLVPFVTAGGGYLRQIHEMQTVIESGHIYHLGGGIKVPLLSRAAAQMWVKQVGVRLDARAVVRTAGVTLDGRAHIAPALAASLFVRF